ncbi:MAG: hypothetical protein AB7F64_06230 [Gammaproteobacteria bacterium]
MGHLYGDVPALLIIAIVLGILTPRKITQNIGGFFALNE